MPRLAVKAKNYVDTDPMVYDLVVSGADGFISKKRVTAGGNSIISDHLYPLNATL